MGAVEIITTAKTGARNGRKDVRPFTSGLKGKAPALGCQGLGVSRCVGGMGSPDSGNSDLAGQPNRRPLREGVPTRRGSHPIPPDRACNSIAGHTQVQRHMPERAHSRRGCATAPPIMAPAARPPSTPAAMAPSLPPASTGCDAPMKANAATVRANNQVLFHVMPHIQIECREAQLAKPMVKIKTAKERSPTSSVSGQSD